MTLIFKICPAADWAAADAAGIYGGSAHDQRDGFIHFSTATQLAGTLSKYYSGQAELLLIGCLAEGLGLALKWEPARDGDLFPHLYALLPTAAALWAKPLPLGETGRHILPAEARP